MINREILSWALYDFANSGFATTILSVIFNVYFVKVICVHGVSLFGILIPGESFWGYTISFSTLVIFFIAPLLGSVADCSASKKKFLFFFWLLGFIFTSFLFFGVENSVWSASFFFIIANIGFWAGNVFYNALLHDISTTETYGRISGIGWALGYIGGGLLLAINLLMIQKPAWFHIPDQNHLPVRFSILSVSFWWMIFGIPIFIGVREKSGSKTQKLNLKILSIGFKNLIITFRNLKKNREVFKYLMAYLTYNDGIETVILMASIFGAKELGMRQDQLILCFLMIQGVAFFGSLIFGTLADKVGHKKSISVSLIIYLFVCFWGMYMKSQAEFWVLGVVVGIILGGSQAASRSLLALMIPKEESAQYFGIFALAGKLSVVIGPFIFGVMAQFFSLRAAVGTLSLFFAAGLLILHFVKEPAVICPSRS